MSRGALLQLVAKSEIDNYLIDQTIKTTVFNNTIKKISNFSEVPFSFYTTGASTWGDIVRFRINKIGDLLTHMYLVLKLPNLSVEDINDCPDPNDNNITNSKLRVKWNDFIGNTIIENVILRIGGQKIDEMSGEYLQFHTELYDLCWSKLCMVGHHDSLTFPQTTIEEQYVYIPLRFFFCNDVTKALPVIALEYHDIDVEIKLRSWDYSHLVLSQVNNYDGVSTEVSKKKFSHTDYHITKKEFTDIRLDCNFIFLDEQERINMVKKRHEILITQTQKIIIQCNKSDAVYLNFTNPIKDLIFAFQRNDYFNLGEILNYSGKPLFIPLDGSTIEATITDRLWEQIPDKHLLENMNIEFNGIERVPQRDYKYWHYVQNYENYKTKMEHNIYMYSFGLNNKENMGSCNFSMIDSVRLNIELSKPKTYPFLTGSTGKTITVGPNNHITAKIYANNYNIFVIESGMGGLMYTI